MFTKGFKQNVCSCLLEQARLHSIKKIETITHDRVYFQDKQ